MFVRSQLMLYSAESQRTTMRILSRFSVDHFSKFGVEFQLFRRTTQRNRSTSNCDHREPRRPTKTSGKRQHRLFSWILLIRSNIFSVSTVNMEKNDRPSFFTTKIVYERITSEFDRDSKNFIEFHRKKNIFRCFQLWKTIHHQNIVSCLGFVRVSPERRFLVNEFSRISLFEFCQVTDRTEQNSTKFNRTAISSTIDFSFSFVFSEFC